MGLYRGTDGGRGLYREPAEKEGLYRKLHRCNSGRETSKGHRSGRGREDCTRGSAEGNSIGVIIADSLEIYCLSKG